MEFIDKRPFLEQEQKLDVEFLKDCYNEDTQSFYPSVNTDQSYSNFVRALLAGRTCFCKSNTIDVAIV